MRRSLVSALAIATLSAGCGAEQPEIPRQLPPPGRPEALLRYPTVGLEVAVPRRMNVAPREVPGVFRASYGPSFVSAFAYRRAEQLPRTDAELATARQRLIAQARRREGSYRLARFQEGTVSGSRAIELLGDQTIGRTRMRIRSLHLFRGRGEYVIEMAAPQAAYERLEPTFDLIEASVRVTGRIGTDRERRAGRRAP